MSESLMEMFNIKSLQLNLVTVIDKSLTAL